ncbi:MAG TPA: GspH/FimT family pseudopilin [Nitrococcus sp.]|nr:GspH/FimT family pseudopilin [Nitrococcus sp.]
MKHSKGFTLIELMITLAVAVILVVAAVPSYRSVVQENRAASQTNALLRALSYARSEAVKHAEVVTICQSSNQSSCGGSTSWQGGWIVFSDDNGNGSLDSSTDILLQVGNGLSGGSTLTAGVKFIRYTASGAVVDTDITQFTLTPASCQGQMRRLIMVTGSGQAIMQKTTCP